MERRLASILASANTCLMFSSVKSNGADEADIAGAHDLCLGFLSLVGRFLSFHAAAGEGRRFDGR